MDTVADHKQVSLSVWSYAPGNAARDEDIEKYALMSTGSVGAQIAEGSFAIRDITGFQEATRARLQPSLAKAQEFLAKVKEGLEKADKLLGN